MLSRKLSKIAAIFFCFMRYLLVSHKTKKKFAAFFFFNLKGACILFKMEPSNSDSHAGFCNIFDTYCAQLELHKNKYFIFGESLMVNSLVKKWVGLCHGWSCIQVGKYLVFLKKKKKKIWQVAKKLTCSQNLGRSYWKCCFGHS